MGVVNACCREENNETLVRKNALQNGELDEPSPLAMPDQQQQAHIRLEAQNFFIR